MEEVTNNNENTYSERIAVSKSTKKMLDECKEDYATEKGLENQYITYDTILRRMAIYFKK